MVRLVVTYSVATLNALFAMAIFFMSEPMVSAGN
jgi:hypothetical protein